MIRKKLCIGNGLLAQTPEFANFCQKYIVVQGKLLRFGRKNGN